MTMSTNALVLDGLILLIFVICIGVCYKRGLLASILSLFGYIIACIGAYIGSKALAETLYRMFFHDRLVLGVKTVLTDELGPLVEDVTAVPDFSMGNLAQAVPEMFRWLVGKTLEGSSALDYLTDGLTGSSENIVTSLIYPTVVVVLQAILFFVLFIALLIVVKIAVKFFTAANRIPVIGGVNALLGAAVGFAEAFVIVLLLTSFVKTLLTAGVELSFLTESQINDSLLFAAFYNRSYFDILNKLPVTGASLLIHDIFIF